MSADGSEAAVADLNGIIAGLNGTIVYLRARLAEEKTEHLAERAVLRSHVRELRSALRKLLSDAVWMMERSGLSIPTEPAEKTLDDTIGGV
jgi:hypothetical protein